MSTHLTNSLCTKLSNLWRISRDSCASAGYPHVAQTRVGDICHMSKSLRVTIQPAAKPLQFPSDRGHTAEGKKRQGARVRRVMSVSLRLQKRISDGARPCNISRSGSQTQSRLRDDCPGRLEIAAAAPDECDDGGIRALHHVDKVGGPGVCCLRRRRCTPPWSTSCRRREVGSDAALAAACGRGAKTSGDETPERPPLTDCRTTVPDLHSILQCSVLPLAIRQDSSLVPGALARSRLRFSSGSRWYASVRYRKPVFVS